MTEKKPPKTLGRFTVVTAILQLILCTLKTDQVNNIDECQGSHATRQEKQIQNEEQQSRTLGY